jgi:hypothetical protein
VQEVEKVVTGGAKRRWREEVARGGGERRWREEAAQSPKTFSVHARAREISRPDADVHTQEKSR